MSLFARLLVYVPVLLLIAVVIVGQHHRTAAETVPAAVRRTVRWLVWTAVLVGSMFVLEVVFIGW